ncbi:MAG TPA: hypothetical protein VJT72_19450 [Pseudonocardiaceae bacterium]|nr:hypothetical protein [Pseudonocardiaceae bacterium]
MLARLLGAQQIVEVGTFTGYSTLCLARGLRAGCRVITCDVSPEWTAIVQYWEQLVPRIRPGGLLVVDNRLRDHPPSLEPTRRRRCHGSRADDRSHAHATDEADVRGIRVQDSGARRPARAVHRAVRRA